jgi:hypothetical protein
VPVLRRLRGFMVFVSSVLRRDFVVLFSPLSFWGVICFVLILITELFCFCDFG